MLPVARPPAVVALLRRGGRSPVQKAAAGDLAGDEATPAGPLS